jgi:hypothetical protein
VDQAVVIQVHLIEPANAGDVDQHASLPVATSQFDQQIGAASDNAGLRSMLG